MSRSTFGSLIKPTKYSRGIVGGCRRSGLLCLLTLALSGVHPFSDATATAQSSVRWIALSTATAPDPVRDRMTALLRDRIGQVLTLNPPEPLTTAAAREALRNADRTQTLFLVTDSATLNDLMTLNGSQYMTQAGLELVNPRIWGRTLYVFARSGLDPRSPLKGWVRWAGSPSPDVRDRAAAVLRRQGYPNVTFETMNVTARMVDAFNRGGSDGGVDIVCIYDEEPSSTVDSFVMGVTQAKTGVRLLLLEPAPKQEANQLLENNQLMVQDGVPATTMPYSSQRFYAWPPGVSVPATAATSSVVVTPPPAGAAPSNEARLPLFLTNARKTGALGAIEKTWGTGLDRVVSQAYLRALFESGVSRCNERDPVSAAQFKTVLLSSFFANRDDAYAVAALTAHLEYARRMRTVEPGAADPILVLRKMLAAEEKELEGTDNAALTKWLKNKIGERESNMRARFAGYPDERIYRDAIDAMRQAVSELQPDKRRQKLTQAHDRLVALAEAAPVSTCGLTTPDRGLWSAIDFEPYFFLAVIDAMNSAETQK